MKRAAAALATVLAVASIARGDKPKDYDELGASEDAFWYRVKHPSHKRYVDLVAQGRALYDQKKAPPAIELLTEATELEPERPEAWFFLGLALSAIDRWDECALALRQASNIDPDFHADGFRAGDPILDESLGVCLAASGHPDEAVDQYQRALGADNLTADRQADLTYNLADAYHSLGRLEDAIEAYKRAIELAPRSQYAALYRFSLAVAYDRDEQGDKARETMIDAIALDPTLSGMGKAVVYTNIGDEDYYRGLAFSVIATNDVNKGACQGAYLCRAWARMHLRRYLARAADSPWAERAKAHLADLGDAAPSKADEIQVDSRSGVAPGAYIKVVLGAAPKLQACLADQPLGLYKLDMYLPGKNSGKPVKVAPAKPQPQPKPVKGKPSPPVKNMKKRPPPPPPPPPPEPAEKIIGVRAVGPEGSDPGVSSCLQRGLADMKWPAPAASSVRVSFAVSAP